MAFAPLLTLAGIGVLIIGTLTFWAAIQNWMAGLIDRFRNELGRTGDVLQSALVTLDRAVVNSQRIVVATGRAVFQTSEGETQVREEVRSLSPEELPDEVRARLERGQPITYELSLGSFKVQNVPTYKLAVRRAD
jgi:hypothetical protein